MNIGNLEMFCRVIEEGSISQAARIGYVSQPAVTSKIRQLEKHYGAELFDRTGGKLNLTESGSALYLFAKEIIDCFKRSEEAVKGIANLEATTLNIGASLTIGEYLLPGILGEFQKENRNVNFNLAIGNTPNIVAQLENRDIDIALVEGIVTHDDLNIEKFAEDELIMVIPSNHRWNDRSKINIEELPQEKMIWREKNAGIREIVENVLRENNVLEKVKGHMELGSTQSIKSAVEAGMGISILPRLSVTRELELGVLKHVTISDIHITRDLWVVKIASRFPKKSMNSFIFHLKKLTK
ncbi:LysR family transcriptional regulator [Virgibacillus necropolis]|uniref:LysR family transcriptional regulator n=1 Tax=Virgibacillus necropolis TaxID=163877 RepID=A0A221MDQ3_9BACI|nr:LysR family transcriptional regulator [Virgibacillus necropolis]ASN05793.1 LysR family transcriptional regulator [Virgibacillus necropolis]